MKKIKLSVLLITLLSVKINAQSFIRPSVTMVNWNKKVNLDSVALSFADKNQTTFYLGMGNPVSIANWRNDSAILIQQTTKISKDIISSWYLNDKGEVDELKMSQRAENSMTKEQLIEAKASLMGADGGNPYAWARELYRLQSTKNYLLLISYDEYSENLRNENYSEGTQIKGTALLYRITNIGEYLQSKNSGTVALGTELVALKLFEVAVGKSNPPNDPDPMKQKMAMAIYNKLNKKYEGWQSFDYTEAATQQAIDFIFGEFTRTVLDFQVVTKIEKDFPIEAPIGIKEGLKIDNRYFVYEKVETDSGIIENRIATIRAKKVAENRGLVSVENKNSKFYQIGYGNIEPGMIIRNKEDYGVGVSIGYGTANWIRLDYRLKGITPGFKVFVEANPFPGKVEFNKTKFREVPGFVSYFSALGGVLGIMVQDPVVLAYNAGLGVEKTAMIAGKLGITPFVSAGMSNIKLSGDLFTYNYGGASTTYSWSTEEGNIYSSLYMNTGLRVSLQLSSALSFVGTTSFNTTISGGYVDPKIIVDGDESAGFWHVGGYLGPETNQSVLESTYDRVITKRPSAPSGMRWDFMLRYEF